MVYAMKTLRHFLLNPKGFRLFNNHRNIVFVFNPLGTKKLPLIACLDGQILFHHFDSFLKHFPGFYKVCADILSRWKFMSAEPVLASINPRIPTTLEEFMWPSTDFIRNEEE
jgi:hypothetical protein